MQRIVTVVLGLMVVGQSIYVIKLGRALSRLEARVDGAPPADGDRGAPAVASAGAPAAPARLALPMAGARPGASPPPVFAATASPPAQPHVLETLGTAEGKQKLQEVLTSLKEQRRADKMVKGTERREHLDQRLREIVGAELGLNPDETRKVQDVLGHATEQRRRAVAEMQSGLKSRAEAKAEMDAANRAADEALKEAIGEKRVALLRELRKREDRNARSPGAAPAPSRPATPATPAAAPGL
jgi:hypothetical protein